MYVDIKLDPKVVLWAGKYNRSHTTENYEVALKEYCDYIKKALLN